jgi:signal peptidase I
VADKQESTFLQQLRSWLDAIIVALIVASVLKVFVFGTYRIPTPSMEDTMETGDFLIVSNLAYGPRTPMVLGIPMFQWYIPGVNLPWTRLPGHSEIQRNDIVVFNYPMEVKPISMKTNYIKRLVGMPGDVLEVRDKVVYIDGVPEETVPSMRTLQLVFVKEGSMLDRQVINELDANILQYDQDRMYLVNARMDALEDLATTANVDSVVPYILPQDYQEFRQRPFDFSKGFVNHDNMGPIPIPYKGEVVELSLDTWHLYKDIVTRYEKNNVQVEGGEFIVNGESAQTYTIQQDYYFFMGDNRDDSEDSRFWGFVPKDHIVGKAWLVYFSWDFEGWPDFSRMFTVIHDQ